MSHWVYEDWAYFAAVVVGLLWFLRSTIDAVAARIDGRLLDIRQVMVAILEEQQALRGSADLGSELQDIRWAIQDIEKALPNSFEKDGMVKSLTACADRLAAIERGITR